MNVESRSISSHSFMVSLFLLITSVAIASSQGIKPVGLDGHVLNLDFEDGTLKDWSAAGDAFTNQPVRGDAVMARGRGMKTEHQGNYWIGTFEWGGDPVKGTLTSVPFKVTYPFAGFLVGGGAHTQTRVELVYADTKKVFYKASGNETETLRWVVLDMRPDQGKDIFIRLVDSGGESWDHINFDNFEFYASDPTQVVSPRRNNVLKYLSRTWQASDGLPHNSVWAVVQSFDGFIWAGTPQGLARFDGQRFTMFSSDNPRFDNVRILYETKDHTLWLGPQNDGLISFKDGKFKAELPELKGPVKSLYQTRDDALWVGTTNGAARLYQGKVEWLRSNGLAGSNVLSIGEDKEGVIWFGTDRGLFCLRGGNIEPFTGHRGVPLNAIRTLYCDKQNSIWFGTTGTGLGRIKDGEVDFFSKYDGLADNFVSTISEDRRGTLWIGTLSGLSRRSGDKFVTELNSEGLSYETVFSFSEDHEGSLWVGTKEGLNQLQPTAFQSFTKEQGVSHNNIMAVCEDRQGTLWAATWGGGVCGLRDGEIVVHNRANGPLEDVLLSICETRDGALWLGSDFNVGLYRFKDSAFTRFSKDEGLIDPAIRVIYEDRAGDLWIGTRQALYQMHDGKLRRFTTADGLAGEVIRAIFEDREGTLWIGTGNGISRRRDGKFTNFTVRDGLSDDRVVSFYEDANDLWIGTEGGGLNRLSKDTNYSTNNALQFKSYTSKQGLFSDSIFEILEDDRGYFWMSCFSGVFRVKKEMLNAFDRRELQTIPCVSFGKKDGMSSVQCNGVAKPAGWKAKDGRLWFPTTRGVVVVDPSSIRENDSAPRVVVEDVVADRKVMIPSDTREPLVFPAGTADFEFNYAALSFRSPEKNRFKFKLEGLDSQWTDAGNRRTAYYNNIRPGNYLFRVMGCNSDGVWNETHGKLAFVLLPHFWQTKWFTALIGILAVGTVAGSVRYVTWRKVRGRLMALEQQHAIERERTRIARDMHDDLGARLTEIVLLSNLAQTTRENQKHVANISVSANEVVRNLDAMVWAVDPGKDSLENLVFYLQEYAEVFLSVSPMRCRLDIPDHLPNLPVASEVRHNIFMVVKEVLNNAVKYSAASEISFGVSVSGNVLSISIEDNGKGFDVESVSSSSNGLANMKKRMAAVGGAISVSSRIGQGTRIEISVHLQKGNKN